MSEFSALEAEWDELGNGYPAPPLASHPRTPKVFWICELGHSYDATLSARLRGRGCPYCKGKKVLEGYNDLGTTHPELAQQWADKSPFNEYSAGSHYEAEWECEEGHLYRMAIYKRASKRDARGCSVCAGKTVIYGVNDAETSNPDLSNEYSSTNKVPMRELTVNSSRNVTWECSLGHLWETSVKARRANGSGCPTCSNRKFLKGFNDLATVFPAKVGMYSTKNKKLASEVPSWGKTEKYLWECSEGHTWAAVPDNVLRLNSGCGECVTRVSRGEAEVFEFLKEALPGTEVLQSQRILKSAGPRGRSSSLEVDIYIPEKSFGIEFNGVFYHSEYFGGSADKHEIKLQAAARQGVRLVTVWEDDWRERPEVVKKMLRHKLGISNDKRVYARNTEVIELTHREASKFLEMNHIQGEASGSVRLGLRTQGELVAVSVFKKRAPGEFELVRYATACIVVGGHSKLVKAFEEVSEWTKLVTFADLEVSDGSLYKATGWIETANLKPDYKYVVGAQREHKFNYRVSRFRDDIGLKFEEGKTEKELAAINGLYRVWDSGKIRYEKHNNNS